MQCGLSAYSARAGRAFKCEVENRRYGAAQREIALRQPDRTNDPDWIPKLVPDVEQDLVLVELAHDSSHTLTDGLGQGIPHRPVRQGTKTFTVSTPGRFAYSCTVHRYMPKGVIQVSA